MCIRAKIKKIIILFLLSASVARAELAELYNKEGYKGQGFIVEVKNNPDLPFGKLYLVTAAHVAQRPSMQARLPNGKPIKILGKISDAEKDIEIWEIEGAEFYKPEFAAEEDKSGKISEIKLIRQDLYSDHTYNNLVGPWQGVMSTKPKDQSLQNQQNKNLTKSFWETEIIGEKNASKAFRTPSGDIISSAEIQPYGLQLSSSGAELEARSKIQPGLSGAPLAQIRDPFIVLGMATSFEKNRMRSYFAKSEDIRELLAKYIQGERGNIGSTRFEFNGPLSYRNYGNGTREANILRRRAGGGDGIRTDGGGGDGIRTDGGGGDGIRTDGGGGDGIRTDGGNRLGRARVGKFEYIPQAGMIFKDHPVVAFRVMDPASKEFPRARLYYADKESFEMLRESSEKNLHSFNALSINEIDFLEIAQTRLRLDPEETEIRFPPSLSYQERCGKTSPKDLDGLYVDINFLELKFTACNGDKVELRIQRTGKINGQDFLPQVEVRGLPSGKKYIVDLRRIFFDNPRKWNNSQLEDRREIAATIIDSSNGQETYFEFNRDQARPLPKYEPIRLPIRDGNSTIEKAN